MALNLINVVKFDEAAKILKAQAAEGPTINISIMNNILSERKFSIAILLYYLTIVQL